ncbi:MAG: 2-oxoacid:acceptor oxidoreductase family protein [Alkalispirochaeta sp.]
MSWKLVVSGVGGQGVISAGIALAEAAVIHEGRYAVQSQSYGAEMRGGLSRADVTISNSEVIYPKVDQAHVLVCLHRKALSAYASAIRPGGLLITDRDEAPVTGRIDSRQYAVPCTATTRDVTGSDRNANICMLGVLVAITGVVSVAAMEAALQARFGTHETVQQAFWAGHELGSGHAADREFYTDSHEAGRHATSARS